MADIVKGMKRALLLAFALVLPISACGAPVTVQAQRLMIPSPTGPHPVGTVSVHLTDQSRQDPWTTSGAKRELMVSLWYPAKDAQNHKVAPWLPKASPTDTWRTTG